MDLYFTSKQVCISSYAQMPGFELEQVDGGSPIELPYGETVLGRGPFLGVSEPLLLCSIFHNIRQHAILTLHKGFCHCAKY